jgi:hypothetical protein
MLTPEERGGRRPRRNQGGGYDGENISHAIQ